jgi:hypothetical protein
MAGTSAQGTRTGDVRRSRSLGVVPTRLRPVRRAAARHLRRVAAWLAQTPRARTPAPAFAALAAAAAYQQ